MNKWTDGLDGYLDNAPVEEGIYLRGERLERVPFYRPGPYSNYSDDLYPQAAEDIVYVQRQVWAGEADDLEEYAGIDASDGHLDSLLVDWVRRAGPDYFARLLAAISREDCLVGLCSRLNLACLAGSSPMDGIQITNAPAHLTGGPKVVRIRSSVRDLDMLPAAASDAVRTFCFRSGCGFSSNHKAAADALESCVLGYSVPQVILVRIAYLAAHALLHEQITSHRPLALN